jgi:hypothetical protein
MGSSPAPISVVIIVAVTVVGNGSFACGSFPRQRQGDKSACCLFSARLRVGLISDPNFESAKLDRVQRYNDRSRAEARQVTTPDLRGGPHRSILFRDDGQICFL